MIETRIEAIIKGGGEGGRQKVGGPKKGKLKPFLRRKGEWKEWNTKGDTTGTKIIASYSHLSICNCILKHINGQRNSLFVFPIVECLFPVIYLYLDCVGDCSKILWSIVRGLNSVSLQYYSTSKLNKVIVWGKNRATLRFEV